MTHLEAGLYVKCHIAMSASTMFISGRGTWEMRNALSVGAEQALGGTRSNH